MTVTNIEQAAADRADAALQTLPIAFAAIVQKHMDLAKQYLCPELLTFQANRIAPFWEAVRAGCGGEGPPYWGWSWPGTVGLARYVIDNPDLVEGKSVLDLGAGNGLATLASIHAGARACIANDIDPISMCMVRAHLQLNDMVATLDERNLLVTDPAETDCDVILVGDLFYEHGLAAAAAAWLQKSCDLGRLVLIGEPGRNHPPTERITVIQTYQLLVSVELENRPTRKTRVLKMH